jgi:hypothetical protein
VPTKGFKLVQRLVLGFMKKASFAGPQSHSAGLKFNRQFLLKIYNTSRAKLPMIADRSSALFLAH